MMNKMEQFQFELEYALEIAVMFDKTGTITYANKMAEEKLEYEEGLKGKNIAAIFPAEFEGTTEKAMERFRGTDVNDLMAYRKNQTCFPVQVRFLTTQYPTITYICTGFDATSKVFFEKKLEQAKEEMKDAQKVKTEFVANVTHELRTPVNGILANTRELLGREEDETHLQKLRLIERGCKDMNALINNILDFSKLEAGKFTLEERKFNFREMMEYVKANHQSKITEKGLNFYTTISQDIPEYIVGDELRIGQILNNLLSNASKFTSVGKISMEAIKTAQIGNRIELFFLVIDTGIGMSKTDMDKLFKSFSQVDASISRRYGGTGLGLNISKQLVELMEGDIHVQSEPGKGTIFSFHIWVTIPDEDVKADAPVMVKEQTYQPVTLEQALGEDELRTFGSEENLSELSKKMSKLILSMEMENWEKAELFMESIRQLTESAPREIKTATLRLKMAVQKGDYEKAVEAYDILEKGLENG